MEYINLKILKYIHKKPRTFREITVKFGLPDDDLNQLLSYTEMNGLYSMSTDNCRTAKFKTTFSGETVVITEKRRFYEVLFSRVLSIISLIVSIAALALNFFSVRL